MPAMQEFLASFAVDIDFGGVDRLQKILSENRDLANRLAAAFLSARSELSALFAETSRNLPSLPPVSITSDRNGAGRREDELSSSLSEISSLLSRLIQSRRGEGDNGSGAPSPAPRRTAAENNPNDTVSRTSSAALPDLSLSALLDLSEASESLQAFEAEAQKPLPLSGDASGITIAAENALTRLRSRFASETLRLNAVLSWSEEDNPSSSGSPASSASSSTSETSSSSGSSDSAGTLSTSSSSGTSGSAGTTNASSSSASSSSFGASGTAAAAPAAAPSGSSGASAEASSPKQTRPVLQSSTGGRFAKRITTEVAEDGDPESIIPVKKENLAVPLLRQLFSELSASARASLSEELQPSSGAGVSPSSSIGTPTTNGVILNLPRAVRDLLRPQERCARVNPYEKDPFCSTPPDLGSISPTQSASPTPACVIASPSSSIDTPTTNGVILSLPRAVRDLLRPQERGARVNPYEKNPFYNTSPDLGSLSPALSALTSLPTLLSSASALFASVSSAPAASAPAPAAANVNQSVQAPVTIQVTSTEASAEAIGRTVYDTAERTLLRTLKGVFV